MKKKKLNEKEIPVIKTSHILSHRLTEAKYDPYNMPQTIAGKTEKSILKNRSSLKHSSVENNNYNEAIIYNKLHNVMKRIKFYFIATTTERSCAQISQYIQLCLPLKD